MMFDEIVADLHVHTTASDGTLALDEVISIAQQRELRAIGITDHDRVHPEIESPVDSRGSLHVIRGIELKVERDSGMLIDLLALGVQRTDELQSLVHRLQDDRIERGRAIRRRVEDRLNVELDVEETEGIGRPHIARAIARSPNINLDVQGAFDELIGEGKPCFVRRSIPAYDEVTNILSQAAEIVGVAHPLRYSNLEETLAVARELGAVERWYPYDDAIEVGPVQAAIERDGLLAIGGSDAHADDVGRCGLDESAYRAVQTAIGIG